MSSSLYDISVSNYLQILGSTINVLEKGAQQGADNNLDLDALLEYRLRPDMSPFPFQVIAVMHHSRGAIEGIISGVFTPPPSLPGLDYAGLQQLLVDARTELENTTRVDIDALGGKHMKFKVGDFEMPFTAENFILSFSLPNFYFHATTIYDMLRILGVPLGKMDFLGDMRTGG